MKIEIEAKISVSSLKPIAQRLRQMGAEFVKRVQETDTYLKDSKGRLFKRGCGLRLRQQKGSAGKTAYLTFKGPKQKGRYKTRTESETEISNFNAAIKIFIGLGYRTAIVVQKTRQIWKWDKCLICLDEVSKLGRFVEVEGPGENQIETVVDQLGLSDHPHISKGYACLMAKALGKKSL